MNSKKNDKNKKIKKLWNRSQTWDKTKAYQNSKISKKRIWFDVWENVFFFLFLFLVSASLLSVRESILKKKKKVSGSLFFPFFFLCQSLKITIGNFRWSQGGQVPPSPPSGSATEFYMSVFRTLLSLIYIYIKPKPLIFC